MSTVVAIYVFVGNSGVLSFGHISFFAVGVWAAGVLSIPEAEKPATMPYLFDFLSSTTVGNVSSLVIAALVGGAFALLVGLPLMRLSGLAAGIATWQAIEATRARNVAEAERDRAQRTLNQVTGNAHRRVEALSLQTQRAPQADLAWTIM